MTYYAIIIVIVIVISVTGALLLLKNTVQNSNNSKRGSSFSNMFYGNKTFIPNVRHERKTEKSSVCVCKNIIVNNYSW